MKKTFAILLALVMILSLATVAMADETTGTITITPPEGLADDAETTYKIYKVFDAVAGANNSVSYTLVDGKTNAPDGFTVDTAGNVTYAGTGTDSKLTDTDIANIAAYVTETDLVDTIIATGSNAVTSKVLPNGYYYITTTTGSVVIIDSTTPNATVEDKNSVPTVDKTITGASSIDDAGENAIAQVGTKVTFTVKIAVGKGAINYKFHDQMSEGLSYNNDVKVNGIESGKYEILTTPEGEDDITIKFADGIAAGTEITIIYTATITENALAESAESNTAWLDYGNNYSTTSEITKVYNAEIAVYKVDGTNNNAALAGAGFVLRNEDGEYYKLVDGVVTWVSADESPDVHTSTADGKVPAFTGLADGTYYLEEKVVPSGYNKAADEEVTIADADVTANNLSQTVTIKNNKGTELPSTGGIGTTIFYIVGGILVVGAAVVLVTKKRMSVAE